MARLNVLNDRGVDAFRDYLEESASSGEPAPKHLLGDAHYSSAYGSWVTLDEDEVFETKQDLGRYLSERFEEAGIFRQEVARDRYLWASIVLHWFDQFSPINEDGGRKIAMEKDDAFEKYPKYIPRIVTTAGEEALRGRRHFALGPYLIFDYNKDTEHQADVLLSGAINVWGDDVEQTAGRIEVVSNKNLIEVIRMLYWDESSSRLKRGYSTNSRPGSLLRLVSDLRNQTKLTKDWYSMSAQQIYDSLPDEYDSWKE